MYTHASTHTHTHTMHGVDAVEDSKVDVPVALQVAMDTQHKIGLAWRRETGQRSKGSHQLNLNSEHKFNFLSKQQWLCVLKGTQSQTST